jgi:hypothetical protein
VFFYLEQEVMKPRYEIHSLGMPEVVEPVESSKTEQRDRAARALFSATEIVNSNQFETEAGRDIPMTKQAEYASRYEARYLAQVQRLAEHCNRALEQDSGKSDLPRIFNRMKKAGEPDLRDAWGTELRIEPAPWYRDREFKYYSVRSAGADQRFDTNDDMSEYVQVQTRNLATIPDSGNTTMNIEHDRGPFNGMAEIAGTVTDPSGATASRASIEAQDSEAPCKPSRFNRATVPCSP